MYKKKKRKKPLFEVLPTLAELQNSFAFVRKWRQRIAEMLSFPSQFSFAKVVFGGCVQSICFVIRFYGWPQVILFVIRWTRCSSGCISSVRLAKISMPVLQMFVFVIFSSHLSFNSESWAFMGRNRFSPENTCFSWFLLFCFCIMQN